MSMRRFGGPKLLGALRAVGGEPLFLAGYPPAMSPDGAPTWCRDVALSSVLFGAAQHRELDRDHAQTLALRDAARRHYVPGICSRRHGSSQRLNGRRPKSTVRHRSAQPPLADDGPCA